MTLRARTRPEFFQALVIVAAGWWIFWPVLHGQWLWDDNTDITDNVITRSATGLWSIWFQPGTQLDYYPVKASVQWAQWHLWGTETFGYHLTNVALHIVGALLVWRLFDKLGLRLAWLGGLLFVIHPTAVESVAWIAELKNTLSLPPFLLAMCFYLDWEKSGRSRDYVLSLGFFLLAMLCKTTMVMFPVVVLLYAWWKRRRIGWSDFKASTPFFVISLALGLMTLLVAIWYREIHYSGGDVIPLGGFFSRMALAGLSLAFYFSKAVLPAGLLPIYPQWVVEPPSLLQFLPWPILAGMIYGCWMCRKSWGRHALFGLGFFLVMLAPFVTLNVGGYTQFTWVMDHFLYIPILGLVGLAVAGMEQVEARLSASARISGIGLLTVVLTALAWGSHAYAKKFVDDAALWGYTVSRNPGAWVAHNNYGRALAQEGKEDAAIAEFQKSLETYSRNSEAHTNFGFVLGQKGQTDAAMAEYQKALEINPGNSEAHNNLGFALFQKGQVDAALAEYQKAVEISPNFAAIHTNLGHALERKGELDEAIVEYQKALEIDPNLTQGLNALGQALFQKGQVDEAVADYQKALQIDPNYAEAHNNLGLALYQKGEVDEAIEHYQKALAVDPANAHAHNNFGIALLQKREVDEAIDQLQKALAIDASYAEAHNSLGVALFQKGVASEALAQFQEALRLKPDYANARDNLANVRAMMQKK